MIVDELNLKGGELARYDNLKCIARIYCPATFLDVTEKSEFVGEIEGNTFRVIRTDPEFNAPGVTLIYYEDEGENVVWIGEVKIDPPA